MTQTVFDFLDRLDGPPSVNGLGGEHTIYASSDGLARDTRVVEVAAALCGEWGNLEDQASARTLLISAANVIPPLGLRDLYDVLLCSEEALPQIAADLERAFKARLDKRGYERDAALEGWTRLALGHWTQKTLQLRGLLQENGAESDVTVPLVRALGAACSMWGDQELLDTLTALTAHDALHADAATELGFQEVAFASAATERDDVRGHLEAAVRWFDTACLDDARPDAFAFRSVITGVVEQISGRAVPADRFDTITHAVREYLEGYRGVHRSWRGARAGTTSAWLDLLTHLRAAEKDRWFDTETTLLALAHAFAAEQTMVLVVNPGMRGAAPQVGIRELVWPIVEDIARGNGAVITHIHRWLKTSPEPEDSATHAAVKALLDRLEKSPSKKECSESVRLPDSIRENLHLESSGFSELERAAAAEPSLVPVLERIALQVSPLNIAEDNLISHLLEQCEEHAEGGIDSYRIELTVLLTHLIRYTVMHLNISQSPNRVPQWMTNSQPWPREQELANDLSDTLRMMGRDSVAELPDVAGGRVDIAVKFERRCTFYIEVKTVDQDRSDEDLVDDFGAQAVQYAATDVPVAFLIVADYVARKVRRDLAGVFRVSPMRLDAASRQHALITVRLQANVASPSASSAKRVTRKQLKVPS